MAMSFLDNFPENQINFKKLKKNKKTKEHHNQVFKSLLALLASIASYISVFYAFDLSPSILISTSTFWFFTANTIIVIVAADFESFSSSKEQDSYKEYLKDEHVINQPSTIIQSLEIITEENAANTCEEKPSSNNDDEVQEIPQEKIISMANMQQDIDESKSSMQNPNDAFEEKEKIRAVKKHNVDRKPKSRRKIKRSMKKFDRSFSDGVIAEAMEVEDGELGALGRTMSERYDDHLHHQSDDVSMLEASNEFEVMSDEQLNRRVEEFIRKFNREIRLQAVTSCC